MDRRQTIRSWRTKAQEWSALQGRGCVCVRVQETRRDKEEAAKWAPTQSESPGIWNQNQKQKIACKCRDVGM